MLINFNKENFANPYFKSSFLGFVQRLRINDRFNVVYALLVDVDF